MNTKLPVYPAVIVASLLGLAVLVLGLLQLTISIEPIEPEISLPPKTIPPVLQTPSSERDSTFPPPASKPTLAKPDVALAPKPESDRVAAGQGGLRISNQTDQPVRVALLAREFKPKSAVGQANYGKPVHWDFAPGEGSRQGLILSLPEGNLKLKKGDILVAFAQDGSRRYWGPYIAGETVSPVWDRETSEWQMILQP